MQRITRIRAFGFSLLAAIAFAAIAAPAASASPASRELTTSTSHTVITTVEHDGRTFEFVRSTYTGIVGVVEISHVDRPTLLTARELREATPLEVFNAVAGPRERAPVDLVRDHDQAVRLAGRSDHRPRTLDLSGAQRSARGSVDYIGSRCSYHAGYIGNSRFTHDWYLELGQHQDLTAQQTYQYEDLNGTSGKGWLAGVTTQRWLSACNGNWIAGFPAFEFRAQLRTTSGSWATMYVTQIEPYHKATYSSFSPGNPQWRLWLGEMKYDVFLNRIYGAAVAGTSPITDITIGQ